MRTDRSFYRRREFLGLTAGLAVFTTRGLFAQQLTETASTTEGPFYPDKLPLDTDNDLLIINDAITPGVGEITHLTGRVLSATGQPVRNAFVEIWQVDRTGSYIHTGGRQPTGNDRELPGVWPLPDRLEGRSTTSARSSPSTTRSSGSSGRPTFTSRSACSAGGCSPRRCSWKAIPRTRATRSSEG